VLAKKIDHPRLADNSGTPYPHAVLQEINKALTQPFVGLTAFSRAPAKGVWAKEGKAQEDDIVIVEVMTDVLETEWWAAFPKNLEAKLKQEEIIIRSQTITTL